MNSPKTLEGEIRDKDKELRAAQKRFAAYEGRVKGVSLEDVQNLKRTALEYYVLNEKMRELGMKYVKLKSKVPTETEKLETAKKLADIQRAGDGEETIGGDPERSWLG